MKINPKIVYASVMIALGSCFLTACSQKAQQQVVYTSESTLTVLETAATQYITGSFGTPKSDVVAEIKAYDEQIYNLEVTMRKEVESGATVSAANQVALTAAITAFQNYLIQQNIIKSGDVN